MEVSIFKDGKRLWHTEWARRKDAVSRVRVGDEIKFCDYSNPTGPDDIREVGPLLVVRRVIDLVGCVGSMELHVTDTEVANV